MGKQSNSEKNLSRSRFIIAAGCLLIIAALVFILLTQESKPDPASEKIIREAVARTFNYETGLSKEPNDLTDEDFARISEVRLGLSQVSSSLTSPSQELADLYILEKFSNLKTLRLENINYPIKAIPQWMKFLAKLGLIDLKKRFAIDLKPIENLHSLQLLQIYNVPVKNIKPLAGLTNLQRLFLENLQLSDLRPIKGLINLKMLGLNDSKVSDLQPLKDMVNLQNLFLDGTQVSDLEPLKGLKSLETLIASNTLITDLEPLKDLVSLRQLFVHQTRVSDLEPIKGLVNLQDLYISGTEVTNLESLKGLVSLKNLYMSETQISDIKPLKGLANLQKVLIGGCNNISDEDVEDLQKALPNLKISYEK
jgi:Leucine-rich repeat (LRR) protein